jgi:hypothetical protein
MWGAALRAAARHRFKFSLQCESGFKALLKAGLETHKVGLYEFTERRAEAQGNVEKLVRAMINAQLTKDPAVDILDEWTIFTCSIRGETVSRTLADLLETLVRCSARLFDHAAFRCFDESYQHVHIFPPVWLGLHALQRL